MKTTVSIVALCAAAAVCAPALAQEAIALQGTAEPYCTLPTTWTAQSSGAGGATGAQFNSNSRTWTIPQAALAGADGAAVAGGEYAVRIFGDGSCNTAHRIQLQSTRGGLSTGSDPSQPAPAGFARRRPIKYDAYWASGSGLTTNYGVQNFTPTAPGQTSAAFDYTLTASRPAPGNHRFDVRMGLQRSGAALMVAGDYSDSLVITITTAN